MVEFASEHADRKFEDDPATPGSLHVALGAAWGVLGGSTSNSPRSVEHFRKAVENCSLVFGEADALTLPTQYYLVEELAGTAQLEAGERVMAAAGAARKQLADYGLLLADPVAGSNAR